MEPYIEFIGTLQNSGFWLVKACIQTFRSCVTDLQRALSCTAMAAGSIREASLPSKHRGLVALF